VLRHGNINGAPKLDQFPPTGINRKSNQPQNALKAAKNAWKRHHMEVPFPCHTKTMAFLIQAIYT
jgi:hypothetical protein